MKNSKLFNLGIKAISIICVLSLLIACFAGCRKSAPVGSNTGDDEYEYYSYYEYEDLVVEDGAGGSSGNKNDSSNGGHKNDSASGGNNGGAAPNRTDKIENEAGDGIMGQVDVSKLKVPNYNKGSKKDVVIAAPFNSTEGFIQSKIKVYEKLYGGKAKFINVGSPYQELPALVASGNSPDLLYYEAGSLGTPRAQMSGLFQPIEKYVDFGDAVWTKFKNYIEITKYNGKAYFAPVSVTPNAVVIYSRNNMSKHGLEEPASLYYKGKWDLQALLKYAKALTSDTNMDGVADTVGLYSDNFESLVHACGKDYIGTDGSKYTINLNDPAIKRIMSFFKTLNKNGVVTKLGWSNAQNCLRDGRLGMFINIDPQVLFSDMLKSGDLGVAPIPQDKDAGKYYHSMYTHGFYMLKDAPNPEAAANFCAASLIETNYRKELIPGMFADATDGEDMYSVGSIYTSITKNCYPVLLNLGGIGADIAYYNLYNSVLMDGNNWSSVVEKYTPTLQNAINNITR